MFKKGFKTKGVKVERPYSLKVFAPKQNMFWTMEIRTVFVT